MKHWTDVELGRETDKILARFETGPKDEEIAELKTEVDDLKDELLAAQERILDLLDELEEAKSNVEHS